MLHSHHWWRPKFLKNEKGSDFIACFIKKVSGVFKLNMPSAHVKLTLKSKLALRTTSSNNFERRLCGKRSTAVYGAVYRDSYKCEKCMWSVAQSFTTFHIINSEVLIYLLINDISVTDAQQRNWKLPARERNVVTKVLYFFRERFRRC